MLMPACFPPHASIVDAVPASMEGNIRTLVRSNRSPNVYDSVASNDAFAAGAASIADIDRLMAELQAASDYLQAEGERVRQINANYAHLAQTVSASARVIAESIGKWHTPEQASGREPSKAMGTGASRDGDTLPPTFEVGPALEKMEQELRQVPARSKPR
jgi:hypothetical protein